MAEFSTTPLPALSSARVETSERLHGWDRLRLLAALDTVALHVTGCHLFAGAGLPVRGARIPGGRAFERICPQFCW